MAGMAATGFGGGGLSPVGAPYGQTYNGMTWDAQRGGYVKPKPSVGTQEHAASTKPQSTVDPMGNAFTYNQNSGNWDLIGQVPGSQVDPRASSGGGGTKSGGGSGGGGGMDDAAFQALLNEIKSGGTYAPPEVPIVKSGSTEPYDRAAESAAYGRAKERTGLAMQAAMRGLKGTLMQRGITGSGIDAESMGGVFESGLGELADTDRQLAEEAADRAFTSEQANTDREIGQRRSNADYQERARQTEAQRLQYILQAYGMRY